MEIKGGRKTWIGGLAQARLDRVPERAQAQRPEAGPRRSAAQLRAQTEASAELITLGVPDKLARAYAVPLKQALLPLGALTRTQRGLDGWRQRSFERVLGQFYKTLAVALGQAPAPAQGRLAKQAVQAMVDLVAAVGTGPALQPAISAAVSLVDTELRLAAQQRLPLEAAALGDRFRTAGAEAARLATGLAGRSNIGTSLNLFPSIVEQVARRTAQITPEDLQASVEATRAFLVEVGPRTGLDQIAASRLSRAVAGALKDGADSTERLLEDAGARFRADYAQGHEDLLAQLQVRVPGLAKRPGAAALFADLNLGLGRLVEAHPTAPPSLEAAVYAFRASYAEALRAAEAGPGSDAAFSALTALVARHGEGPLAEAALRFATTALGDRAQWSDRSPRLLAASKAEQGGAAAAQLLQLLFAEPAGDPALKRALATLSRRDGAPVLELALALDSELANRDQDGRTALVRDLIRLADRGGHEDGVLGARAYFERVRDFHAELENFGVCRQDLEQRWALASALAEGKKSLSEGGAEAAARLLAVVPPYFRAARLASLAADEPSSRGILSATDPALKWKAPMSEVLGTLLGALARAGVSKKPSPALDQAVRRAVDLAFIVGRLDGQYEIPFNRIRRDFQAAYADPKQLKWATPGDGTRTRAKSSVEAFLAGHPELPRELALTAGLHLNRVQLDWLVGKVGGLAGRDTVRRLRDFVFACVTAGRLDLLDAVRRKETPPKFAQAVIEAVAFQYREGHLNRIKFDRMVAGLKAGGNPAAEIQSERLEGALGELKLKGPLDPQGVAELNTCAVAIKNLLEFTKAGKMADGIDLGVMKAPFLAALQSVADGSWPAAKYDTPLAAEIFKKLSPQQQAIWRSSTVVEDGAPLKAAVAAVPVPLPAAGLADPRFKQAKVWVNGLAVALGKVKLKHPKFGVLVHDRATEKALRSHLGEQIERLHHADKGTPAHRTLSAAAGHTREVLALLSLELALKRAKGEPRAMLAQLGPYLEDGLSGLRKLGFGAGFEVAADLHALAGTVAVKRAPTAAPGVRGGTYAIDEDRLEPLLMSTTGGCIHHANVRRWANINLAVNPHEKMVRTYHNGDFVYRACIKLFEGSWPGYQGPVLWMNHPNSNGGGNQAHLDLLLRQVLSKGKEMGLPVVSTAWNGFGNLPAQLGMKHQQVAAKISAHDGATGSTFTDYSFHESNIRKARGNAARFTQDMPRLNVVMPR